MNHKLWYTESGQGEPFLFLHGNGEDSSYFKNQIEYFRNQYHVFALDTRGHGKSPRGTAPFTLEQFSDDLYNFMKKQQITNPILLGFSDGANIAIKFALKYGNMVKAFILNGANLNPRGVKRSAQIPIELEFKAAKLFAPRFPSAQETAEMLGLMVNEPDIRLEELSQITVPTLVICGSNDMIKTAHTKEIAAAIPNAELTILKGDHFIARKHPAEFNQAVDRFLKTIFPCPAPKLFSPSEIQ